VNAICAILLDFDYTLADSSQGATDCIAYALRELGLPPTSYQAACKTIGLSLADTLTALAGPQPAKVSEAFARLFVERADEVMADRTVLLPGVAETLTWLQDRDVALGVVSTKYRRRIETILRRERLLDAFTVIVGGEDVSRHKPDPESLLLATELLGVEPKKALYVGDSVTDARAAQNAGMPFAAVLSGTTPRVDFARYGVCAVLASIQELTGGRQSVGSKLFRTLRSNTEANER
jgi:phosphoglycolate phosphatase